MNSARSPEGELAGEDVRVGGESRQKSGDDAVYFILAAELAGQRGQYEVALDNYLKAAALTQDVKILQRTTQIALYLKKTDKALEAAASWQRQDPGSPEARRLTAMLLLKAGRHEEAFEQLAALLAMPGIDAENTLLDLVKLMNADVPKEVSADFMRRLEERFPRMAEVHFASALLASDRGDYRLALAEADKALSLRPDWNRARLLQAQVLARMGDPQKAREPMRRALQADPGNMRLRLVYAQFLAKSGDLPGAEKEIQKVLAKEPRNEDALLSLGMVYMERGQEAKAKPLFERLVESTGRKAQAFFYLGLIEARKHRLQSAVEWFDKVEDGPMLLDAQVNAVTALIGLEQYDEARERLAESRKQFPQEAVRLYLMEAELLTKNKDYAGAFELLNRALEAMPGQVELLYTRALVAEELGKPEVLEADLRAVLEKKPDDPNALNALGFTLADRGERLDEAKRYIAKSLELKPDDPAILDSYGWVHYRLGDYPTALEYLRRAYGLLKNPEIGAHFGEVLWESGKREEAKKVWEECLRQDADDKDMKKVMARYPEAFK